MRVTYEQTRVRGNEFCTLSIELRENHKGQLCLSITGQAGHVVSKREAKRWARSFWESFFEDSPGEIIEMNRRFGTRFLSARSAASYVLRCDGEFHGVDVVYPRNAPKKYDDRGVFICHSCGQIREEIADFFPEVMPLFAFHLNDMRRGPCGESWEYKKLPDNVLWDVVDKYFADREV